MLVKTVLPTDTFKQIVNEIGSMMAGLLDKRSPRPDSVEIRESFEMWTLNLENLKDRPPNEQSLPVVKTGYWHHQILFDRQPRAHALSKVLVEEPACVLEVAISPLAKKIDDAIEWVENPERDWATSDLVHVQLLALPSLLIYTFRLVEPKKVYVINAFPGFVNLQPGQLLDEVGFLAVLYSDLRSQEENYGDSSRR